MSKKLLALMITLPLGISAMEPPALKEWDRRCEEIYNALMSQTAKFSQVQEFFSQEIPNLPTLGYGAEVLQNMILENAAGEPSESKLASLYFLKEIANKLPESEQLEFRLDEITRLYNEMYPKVFPSADNAIHSKASPRDDEVDIHSKASPRDDAVDIHSKASPRDDEVDIQKASIIDMLRGKLLSLKGGIALALIGYLVYRSTHREKKPKHKHS